MNILLPYGKTHLSLEIPHNAEVLGGQLGTEQSIDLFVQQKIVHDALRSPIDSDNLEKLAQGKKTATIIISDHTRPVPSKLILPPMFDALRLANPKIDITLLVSTGCHRGPSKEELVAKLGEEIVAHEKIVIHDCDDESMLIDLGNLPSGVPLKVNKLAVETDLLLAEGFIEPHFFAGFSGGRKSVLPGVCGRTTVMSNHCAEFIDSENARFGILQGNPLHIDMVAAAQKVRLAYIVNVVLDAHKQVVFAVAGNAINAHEIGCEFMAKKARVLPAQKGDVVITTNGGYPLDQNIYQTVKGLATAEAVAAKGAILILCAECSDGMGGDHFYRALKDAPTPTALLENLRKVPAPLTTPDQWQYQILARILEKHQVLFVTLPSLKEQIEQMHMTYCESIEQALTIAHEKKGKDAHTVILPDGVSVYA